MENNEISKEENINLQDNSSKQNDANISADANMNNNVMKHGKIIVGCLAFILVLFFVSSAVFSNAQKIPITGEVAGTDNGASAVRLSVNIPCSGHAQLIIQNIKSLNGVKNVQFSFPNIFNVEYDPSKTTVENILKLDVFNTYKAQVIGG